MKKLTRIKLINWQFYQNEEFHLEGDTLISGMSGSGKSSLLDALGYVLSGSNWKFNLAANENSSKRTLSSYMKGATGYSGTSYIRDEKDLVSHIVLEFQDDDGTKTIIGVALEIVDNGDPNSYFYILKRVNMDDSFFFEDGKLKTVTNFIDYLFDNAHLDKNSLIRPSGTKKDRKKLICDALNVTADYSDYLKQAIAFHHINNLTTFARDFLFKERPLDTEELRKAAKKYSDINLHYKNQKEEIAYLEPIATNGESYLLHKKNVDLYSLYISKLKYQQAEKDYKTKDENYKRALANEKAICSALEEYQQKYDDAYGEYIKVSSSNDLLKNYQEYKNHLEKATKDAKNEESALALFQKDVDKAREIASALGVKEGFSAAYAKADDKSMLVVNEEARTTIERFHELKDKGIEEKTNLKAKETELLKTIDFLQNRIFSLEKNQIYLPKVNKILSELKAEAEKREVSFSYTMIANLIEINDDSYRGAMESLFGPYRFDFILDEEMREIALDVFASDKDALCFFGNGFVKHPKMENPTLSSDSLLAKISVPERGDVGKVALNYLFDIFGDIKAVSSAEDFKEGKRAITPNGLYFDGEAVHRLTVLDQDSYFIGSKGREKQKESLKAQLEKCKRDKADCSSEIQKIQDRNDRIEEALRHLEILKDLPDYFAWLKKSKEDIEKYTGYLNALKEDSDFIRQEKMLNESEGKRKSAKEELDKWKNYQRSAIDKTARCELDVKQAEKDFNDAQDDYQVTLAQQSKDYSQSDIDTFFQDYEKQNLNDAIASKTEEDKQESRSRDAALQAIAKYKSWPQADVTVGEDIESLPVYIKRYHDKNNIDLQAAEQDAKIARDNMRDSFRQTFLYILIEDIQLTLDLVADINKILKRYTFGPNQEYFKLGIKPSPASDFMAVSTILFKKAKDDNLDFFLRDSSFEASLNNTEKEEFNNICRILIDDEVDKQKIESYCDYRNYFSVSLSEESSLTGNYKNYDSARNTNSGGEIQTAFYAMIGSALYVSNKSKLEQTSFSPCNILIMDEAFESMDSDRIQKILDFYHQLGLQMILCVPETQVASLQKKMMTRFVIIREGNKSFHTENHTIAK